MVPNMLGVHKIKDLLYCCVSNVKLLTLMGECMEVLSRSQNVYLQSKILRRMSELDVDGELHNQGRHNLCCLRHILSTNGLEKPEFSEHPERRGKLT
jgi:hypothetical protein